MGRCKGHWVNGVEEKRNKEENKPKHKTYTRKENKPHQSTIKPTQENKTTTPDGVGGKKNGQRWAERI